MSNSLPSARMNNSILCVHFLDSPVARSVEVASVVDQNDFGDVTGVEILDLRRQLTGGVVDAPATSGRVRWSYDSEVDAFYVRVTEGRSQVQTSVTSEVSLDVAERVVSMKIPVPPAAW